MGLDQTKLMQLKYLKDRNGYIVGAKLFNRLGLTTQVPNVTDIVTNECNLDFEKIIKYARETNSKKILDKLFVLAR